METFETLQTEVLEWESTGVNPEVKVYFNTGRRKFMSESRESENIGLYHRSSAASPALEIIYLQMYNFETLNSQKHGIIYHF